MEKRFFCNEAKKIDETTLLETLRQFFNFFNVKNNFSCSVSSCNNIYIEKTTMFNSQYYFYEKICFFVVAALFCRCMR